MIRRILNLIVALSTIAVSATAQTLSVSSIETELGAQTEIVVNVEGASEMTALQFTLNLPDGVSLSYLKGNCGMYLGDATNEHVMSVSPLSDGGRFIMIYSTDLNTFSDGVLLRIPVKMPAEVCSENGSFSDICFSTVNADSRECSDVAFSATSKLPEARTEFEVNGIQYVFLENYYGEEGLSVWVTSTRGYVLSDDYSGYITIPSVVTYRNVQYPVVGIKSEAFAGCTINSLTLAEGVKYLVPYNYGTCFGYDNTAKIKEVYLPSTFTISRKDAFVNEANGLRFFPGDMGLEKIVIADENPEFDSRDNCNAIIETATNTLWDGCIIRKTKRFAFFERTARFFRTKRTSVGYPPFSKKIRLAHASIILKRRWNFIPTPFVFSLCRFAPLYEISMIALYAATLSASTILPRKARRDPIAALVPDESKLAFAHDTPPTEYA